MPTEEAFSDEELRALLRDRSVSARAIAEEMSNAGTEPLSVEALESTRQILDALDAGSAARTVPLPEPLRRVVLEGALASRAADFVAALTLVEDKPLAKEAKRLLHRLRAGGLKVEPPKPVASSAFSPPVEEELVAYMSSIDQRGERALFHPCTVRGGIDIAQVILSDEGGLSSAELVPLGRRGFRRFVERLAESSTLLVAAVPRAYSRSLIARALDRNAVVRRPVPPGFNEVAFALGSPGPALASPGRSLEAPGGEASESEAQHLLAARELQGWAPPEPLLRELRRRLESAGDPDRSEKRRELLGEAVQEFWTPARRALWAERLYDMAWLFHGAGRQSERARALVQARALESDAALEAVGFASALWTRALEARPLAPSLQPLP